MTWPFIVYHKKYSTMTSGMWSIQNILLMSIKNGGGLGKNECKQICCHKEWTLTYYHSFLNLSEKFFHSKAFFFLVYSVYINVEKVYQRLLQCVAQLGNHWPNHVQVSWRKLLAACVSQYQQEFCRKFTPSEQMQYCLQWQTLKTERTTESK